MIVDTSALIAVMQEEEGWERIRDALADEPASVPASALSELGLVAAGRGRALQARELVADLIEDGLTVIDFTEAHAALSWEARDMYGKGNGKGGILNLLDLMVYAVAKVRSEPLLCTGKDYAATDVVLHPACRPW